MLSAHCKTSILSVVAVKILQCNVIDMQWGRDLCMVYTMITRECQFYFNGNGKKDRSYYQYQMRLVFVVKDFFPFFFFTFHFVHIISWMLPLLPYLPAGCTLHRVSVFISHSKLSEIE